MLDDLIHVSTLEIVVTHIYRACFVLFMNFQTWANLVILNMIAFDMILGMTWLSPYYVMLNYNAETVTLEIFDKERLKWKGVFKPKPAKIISFI